MEDDRYRVTARFKRFPLCITWTPIPVISWIFPFIGHTGIADSRGVIHDFAGPYYISQDKFAFGETHKYVKLANLEEHAPLEYDDAINKANEDFKKLMHNLICNNCHLHVARALNYLGYKGAYRTKMATKNNILEEGRD